MAYLLVNGELPTAEEFETWRYEITHHTFIHENVRKKFLEGFHHDAHPMGILVATIAALSTFYPEAKDIFDPEVRRKQIVRLIAKMPTLAAGAYRFSRGMPFVYPDNSLDFSANFLSMLFKTAEPRYDANPVLAKALDVLFILHADHEQNCSTTAMRTVGSAHADPYVATAAAASALYGPRHGGANEAVLHMLERIGSIDNVPAFIDRVKAGEERLMGFGHRVYKNFDPRATIIKNTAYEVFDVTGKSPLLDIALKLEEVALADNYFVDRKLYPNVDFYSGLIYQAMGFPMDMFTVLFAIPRGRLAVALHRVTRAGPAHHPPPPDLRRCGRARLRALLHSLSPGVSQTATESDGHRIEGNLGHCRETHLALLRAQVGVAVEMVRHGEQCRCGHTFARRHTKQPGSLHFHGQVATGTQEVELRGRLAIEGVGGEHPSDVRDRCRPAFG